MTTVQFLSHLRSLGVKLWAEDERLRFRAPQNVMTPELKAELAERKGEILAFLRQATVEAETPPAITPIPRNRQLPLSFAQERLWFIDQWQPGSATYNLLQAVRLHGALNVAVVEQSLSTIIRRHEALRTTFAAVDEQPVQIIHPAAPVPLLVIDLEALPPAEREAEAQRLVNEEAQRPFDLAEGPLVRAALLRLSADDHMLLLNMHHIVSDGWSVGVVIKEFAALYTAGALGHSHPEASRLPELPVQYADFAAWQRQWLQGPALERQIDYWRRELAGAPGLLELPTDRPRPPVQSFRGANEQIHIAAALAAQLGALSQQHGVTLFQTLLAAFQTLLHRLSGQQDILVGSPIAGRNQPEVQPLIGFFVNMLVLRANFAGNPSFIELLQRVNQTTLGAYAHQDLPFEKLVEALQPERTTSYSPLFQVGFLLEYAPTTSFDLPDLTLSLVEQETGSAKIDLTLAVMESSDGLWVSAEYATDLFEAATIRRMLQQYATLLAAIADNPQQRVALLPLMTDAEQRQILVEWNATAAPFPDNTTIHALVEAQVARTPDAIAVVCGDKALTYADLDRRANQLARQLQALGVGPEARVGVCLERSVDLVVALLATLKAGGGYVPLDPEYPQDRLRFMLEDSQAQALVTTSRLLRQEGIKLPVADAQVICLDSDWEQISRLPDSAPRSGAQPENLAYMIYTSGSTGTPKGVMVQHRSVCNNLWWRQQNWPMTSDDRMLHTYSFSFDPSVWACFCPLIVGAQVILLQSGEQYDGAAQVRLILRHKITLYGGAPSIFSLLLEEPDLVRCTSMRSMLSGGDRLTGELQRRLFALLNTELVNAYGPTEATVDATLWRCERVPDPQPAPIGHPVANTQVYLLDRHLQPVPIGVAGEIYIGGAGLARGYHDRPDLTAEKFIPDPFSSQPGARLYRTGDLGRYRPDGAIEFLDRSDFQVKIRGFRIELGEIEAVLLRHPAVQEAVVLAREDVAGDKRLVAYVVAEQNLGPGAQNPDDEAGGSPFLGLGSSDLGSAELRAFLQQSLPDHMIPAAFVMLESLPLTSNGKIDHKALPAPDFDRSSEAGFVAPRTPTEEVVAGIWAEIFGLARVGAHDDFFALGGHSLLATRVVSRIRATLQAEVPIRALFEGPTVAQLAARIESLWRTEHQSPPIVAVADRPARIPLSFAQQRLWFLDQLQPNTPAYNIPTALRLSGELDVAALEASLNTILARHEVLRTTFALVEGEPVQIIHPEQRVDLRWIDLQSLDSAERERVAHQVAVEEIQRPFDLQSGPLLCVTLARLQPDDHLLILVLHHIIADGWSMSVFVQELTTLYAALIDDAAHAHLPALPIQYADYAIWQRQWLQGEVLEQQLDYWKDRLAHTPVLNLPTDYARPAEPTTRGANYDLLLAPALQSDLVALSRREGATLFMTLLAAFDVLLYRYSHQHDFAIGTPVAHRTRGETETLLGCFVNTLVLRADLSGQPTFRDLLQRVRETALEAYAHQDLPFEQVVDALQPQRDLSHHPLFQVMFALQNTPPSTVVLPGLTLHPVELPFESAKFDLSLFLAESDEGLVGGIEYSIDLFAAETIERMAEHFQTLLQAIVANPDQRIDLLPILTEAERRQLVIDWNATALPFAHEQCIHELFAAQVQRTPAAPALIAGHERLTYAELDQRSSRLARVLQSLGVGPEVPVGICLDRSAALIVGLLAILKAGGYYVPLDPAYPAERLQFMLDDTQAPVLLTTRSLRSILPPTTARQIYLDESLPEIANDRPLINKVTSGNLAYIIYTSGSTGRPKGVAIAHRSAVAMLAWSATIFSPDELAGTLAATSICFDISVFEIFHPLTQGGAVILAENALALPHLPAAREVTLVNTVPSAMAELVRSSEIPDSVRIVNLAGEPLKNALVQQVYQRQPSVERVYNLYGPSEDTTYSTFELVRRGSQAEPTVGRPIANTQAYILDRQLQSVPIGVAGEVYLGGAGVSRGYLNRPDLTAEKYLPDPFSDQPGSRMYRTGDLARYLPDSRIVYLGRIDHQVKIRGFRIELGEIEARLISHPAVREAVVLARADVRGDQQIVAYVTEEQRTENREQTNKRTNEQSGEYGPGAAGLSNELKGFLRQYLPEYMIPSTIMVLDALPLLANGKIDRRSLPEPQQPDTQSAIELPRDPIELRLAQIWQELLGVTRVGIRDSFFELGGHSLLAVRLMAQIREQFGQQLPLATLFHGATIEHLAGALRQQAASSATSLVVPIQPSGSKRPLVVVHPVGGSVFCYVELAQMLGLDQPLYGIQAAGMIDGLEPDTSIEAMAARYLGELKAIQPHGPYHLGGWSLGGVVAFEMARQLHEQGEDVALLALIDSRLSSGDEAEQESDDLALLGGFAYDLGLPLEGLSTADALLHIDPQERMRVVYEQARQDGMIPPDVTLAQIARLFEVYKTNLQTLGRYKAQMYNGHVTLFQATEPLTNGAAEAALAWQQVTSSINVCALPGDHYSLLRRPNVKQLVEQLQIALEEAQMIDQP